jgi:small nuclear ribonucleoprotein B and B'
MSLPKSSKMYQYINYRMKVTIQDSRTLVGKFLAFDKHMNVVLSDCEEYRKVIQKGKNKEKTEKTQKRMLGLVLLRGDNVVSLTVESPPPVSDNRLKSLDKSKTTGPGLSKQSSRGISISTGPLSGLSGPISSFGSQQNLMVPQLNKLPPPPMGRGMFMNLGGMKFPPPPMGFGLNLEKKDEKKDEKKE